MKARLWTAAVLAAAGALALLVATRQDPGNPHLRLFSDMVRPPSLRTYSESALSPDGRSWRAPVPGTVRRGGEAPRFAAGAAERARAARTLKNPVPASYEALGRGRKVYASYCRHCHGPRGRGDGPVAKAVTAFSFPLATKSALDLSDGEVYHIVSYGRNNMPAHASQIPEADRWALVHFLRDLQRTEVARQGTFADIPEDPRRHSLVTAAYGQELYTENCASCHGPDGSGQKAGVPTLHSPAVLAVADDAYYWDIIMQGRKGTQMPGWSSTLTKTQVQSLIAFLRSWQTASVDRALVSAERGDPRRGRSLFRGHCAGCHGIDGEGGIGNSLRSPSFLSIASDQFLRDTVLFGRKHTAMPASYDFSTGDLSDIVAFIRSWHPARHDFARVKALLPAASAATGKKVYDSRCSGCHGDNGEGGLGSVLNSDSFLSLASDDFLYTAIAKGRPGTGMPAWRHLSAEDAADLLALLRSWQKTPAPAAAPRPKGKAEYGKLLYERGCVSCHGAEGQGGVGGQLANPVFQASASDEFLWRTIAYGKQGSAMRGFLKGLASESLMPLDEADVGHLVAYVRSLGERPRVEPLKRAFAGASAAVGKTVFEGKGSCTKCHGQEGEGSSGPSLTNEAFLRVASDGFLAGTVLLGRDGTEMRSYHRGGNVSLTQQDVKDLIVYLRGFEANPTARRRRVERTASSVGEGKVLYGRFCSACHGLDGNGLRDVKGGYAPSLSSKEFLSAADDGLLLATIALGRPNTAMRPFARAAGGVADLSASDIRKIVAFIRSWEGRP
ncbi:MAG: c-type cytochrome [Elusimicrobia bacterium]|nr:c-type cytochrome [Elusimicrobiota bacterium]